MFIPSMIGLRPVIAAPMPIPMNPFSAQQAQKQLVPLCCVHTVRLECLEAMGAFMKVKDVLHGRQAKPCALNKQSLFIGTYVTTLRMPSPLFTGGNTDLYAVLSIEYICLPQIGVSSNRKSPYFL